MPLDTATPETALDSTDDSEMVQYRAVCGVSIVAVVLGLASASALMLPLFWCVPPVAALVAFLALARIHSHSAELTGRGIAISALCLAVFFGVWAPTRYLSQRYALFHKAEEIAEEWFNLVREGKRHEAYELHLALRSRQPANVTLQRYYENSPEPQKALDAFFGAAPLKEIAAAGDRAEIFLQRYVAVETDEELSSAQVVIIDYEARLPGPTGETVQPLRMFLRRRRPEADGAAQWEVLNVIDPTKKTGS